MGVWGGDTLKDERLYRLGRALYALRDKNFSEPLLGNAFTSHEVARKFRCSWSNVFDLLTHGNLHAERQEKDDVFPRKLFAIKREHLVDFVQENLHSSVPLSVDIVLDSQLLLFEEVSCFFRFSQNTLRERLLAHDFLSYLVVSNGKRNETRRFVGRALELNLLQYIAYTLGISEPLYTPKLLIKRWSKPLSFVSYWTEQKVLNGIFLGGPNSRWVVYHESEIKRFERASYLGRSINYESSFIEVIFK